MRIIVASDQIGFSLKQSVLRHLIQRGIDAVDGGPETEALAVDYPDFADSVTRAVSAAEFERGVLVCGTGIGMSIAANRRRGIRAALCHDVYTAHMARAHNNANVICLGAWIVTPQRAEGILDEWLGTEYEQGRHVPRLTKIDQLTQQAESGLRSLARLPAPAWRTSVSLSPNRTVFGPLLFAGQLEEGVAHAATAGFDAVELSLRTANDIDLEGLASRLAEVGLAVSGIATGQSYLQDGLSFCHPDPQVRLACVARLKSLVPIAARMGAVLILGGVRGRLQGDPATWQAQRAGAIEAMRAVARCAADQGTKVMIEPINRYETNFINTADDALSVIDEIAQPSVQVLLDTFHMNIEEADIPATLKRTGSRLGYVHVADSNRRAPGGGHFDFAGVLHALNEMGYSGTVAAEILPIPDDRSAAAQAGLALGSWKCANH